ncbi:MAG: rRNA maturation RNase YbeY [Flavobacteriales bacterium]
METQVEEGELLFHTQSVRNPIDPADRARSAEHLKALIRDHSCIPGELNIVFCSDEVLQGIHERQLQKSDLTDIITFDHVGAALISGDLFISTERVAENARSLERPEAEELHRVMAHGILHLLGYKDKSPEEKTAMRKAEQEALQRWGFRSC